MSISSYRVNDIKVKIEQFADDCTFILNGSCHSFVQCLNTVSNFSLVSGFCLNIDKTRVLWLGDDCDTSLPKYVQASDFGCVEDKFKYLGIIFARTMKDMNVISFQSNVIDNDIASLLKGWLRRKLTVHGRGVDFPK